ncbi:MFS transporter [Vulcanisaeta distributa]|uniref:Major facilitator superfamily MFS_1 n=1 Tax=Vulcanisaeta distributa (strain DSM 14429 / JCM 11212 / NBRC 100878 / IC-017) TaxID=572478 RepID=E1QSY0_VULDI|nr:MFS transporter [Vulcanisaeta distributa]ADN50847.1 major facilitator superfamily MFS_1 [Vulcanisaeta distributa DSM 14429]
MSSWDVIRRFDEARLTLAHYRWTVLAAMGDFLDAGSIVAGAVSTIYWISTFHLTSLLLGIIAAFSPNAFAAFVGAIIAGPLGDRYGRKTIYMYDLLAYFIGALIMAAAVNYIMLLVGYIIVGIAVGLDVPTSWSLIAEYAPKYKRGFLMAFTNLFWYIGPIVMLLLGIAFEPYGALTFRAVFGVLAAVAIITWILRRGLIESPRWGLVAGKTNVVQEALKQLGEQATQQTSASQGAQSQYKYKWSDIFKYKKGLAFIIPIYIFWGVPAGTFGFFLPYFFKDIGFTTTTMAYVGDILWFITAIIGVVAVYMQLSDKLNRNVMYAVAAAICAISFAVPIFLPFSILWVALLNVIGFGFGHGMWLWPQTRVWSTELFPTEIRNSAQGFAWSWMRFALGVWSLIVPTLIAVIGYKAIAAVATTFFILNIIIGYLYGPKSQGKSLEEVLRDFYGGKIP